jgi:16S rRNA (guanine1207-N2)-methyltransferase
MTLAETLEHYHNLSKRPVNGKSITVKAGLRKVTGLELFFHKSVDIGGHLLDLTGSLGELTLRTAAAQSVILETSRAALRCLQATFSGDPTVTVAAGASWDAPRATFDTVCLVPSTDKGNRRVALELYGVQQALKPEGSAYILMHKDQGAKRYEKSLSLLFEAVTVIAKSGGWRLTKAKTPILQTPPDLWTSFEAAGLTLSTEAGVYAAGKLDPGTEFLLESFDVSVCDGQRVLDIGCGYGLLAIKAALAQGDVTALDDDLLAARATHKNAKTFGTDIRVLHSDVNSELKTTDSFDIVLMNPPFHRGKQVNLDVPQAFIAAAHQHLAPGGTLVLVANRALPYEPLLEQFAYWEEVTSSQHFKVLQAYR